jgi:metal-responsive CopG/Arc/MetJ family transcriptional regulator
MKTIAISVEDTVVRKLDALVSASSGVSRSSLVRDALEQYLRERERTAREARDDAGYGADLDALAREEAALVAEQAAP